MLKKILVANRGEIAIRVMRACRELGVASVAVYSEADKDALHAKYADESLYIGESPPHKSYLNIDAIMAAAKEAKADAVHPGYGFLAENARFAARCEEEGIVFIGPTAKAIELMGNKVVARQIMQRAGVRVVPGSADEITELEEAKRVAAKIGYPVMVKAAGGGGGIGMRIVHSETELEKALEMTRSVAKSAFGDGGVFLEKYLTEPRHIEIQVLADTFGNTIYLGERECSIQRRHQKLIEESPSPVIDEHLRKTMGEVAVKAAKAIDYTNAGTIEFIFAGGTFHFLEMNTRIQVEHPVTEMVTGVDIVKEQIRIASGLALDLKQEDVSITGWAIECRINAEDPLNNFSPVTGRLRGYRSPGGVGIRVDSGVHFMYTIPSFYDSMISKLVVHGRDRTEAIDRMKRALYEYVIVGVTTNIPYHLAVMEDPVFRSGKLSTHFVDQQAYLIDETRKIVEQHSALQDKLSNLFKEDKQAAAATAAVTTYLSHLKSTSSK